MTFPPSPSLHAALTARLDAIGQLCDAAPEGPWSWGWEGDEGSDGNNLDGIVGRRAEEVGVESYGVTHAPTNRWLALTGRGSDGYDRALFIAAARTDVPALVAALRAVVDLHQPIFIDGTTIGDCAQDGFAFPCPTVRALAAALGVSP